MGQSGKSKGIAMASKDEYIKTERLAIVPFEGRHLTERYVG